MSGNREAIATHTFFPSIGFPSQGISVFAEGQIHPSRGQRGGPLCSLGDGPQVRRPHWCHSSQCCVLTCKGGSGIERERISLTPGTEWPLWICPINSQFHGKALDPPSQSLPSNKMLLLQRLGIQYPMPDLMVDAGDTAANELGSISWNKQSTSHLRHSLLSGD